MIVSFDRLVERWFGGHVHFAGVTIYGRNAMHWGVNIWTRRWGYICFRLPLSCFGRWWPLYFYVSPNATPWAATFLVGHEDESSLNARKRRLAFGHNFDVDAHYQELSRINGYAESVGLRETQETRPQ